MSRTNPTKTSNSDQLLGGLHIVDSEDKNAAIAKIASRLKDAKRRCTNPKPKDARRYAHVQFEFKSPIEGARQLFEKLGPIPPGLSLDRVDPFGPYSLNNLRYAGAATQRQNQRPRGYDPGDDLPEFEEIDL